MCGICGFTGPGTIDDLRSMNSTMTHRGPDNEGYWTDEKGVFIAHKRLSIIDLKDGAQPMQTEDGNLIVSYNGEIYNHLELRNFLEKQGYIFKTDHSDTEVLLHGFREWGDKLPDRLNGMWAFAIYDKIKKRLFLSRDRFGKKPLFYTLQNNIFAFASELHALTKHPKIKASISQKSLKKYFAYGYIPAPNSYYQRIHKLPAGHNLIFDVNTLSINIQKYWEFILEPFETIPKNPDEEWGETLRELISRSVKRRLMSDVPLGVFLSGGIDSSAITAFASRFTDHENLKTFSIGFHEKSFDESRYSKNAADLFQTDHYQEMLSMERARDLLPNITGLLDEPMGDSSLLPTYLLCRETRKHVTVALGGDGADELFAGYDPFPVLKLTELYSKIIPKTMHRAILTVAGLLTVSHNKMSMDFKIKRALKGLSYPKNLWHPVWFGPNCPLELEELFQEPTDIEDVYSEAIDHWETCPQKNLVDKTLHLYTKMYLQDDILAKTDRASMMHSLEVRAPFLDIDLVDFVRRIPHSWKYRNRQTKYILKKALEPILPHSILYRPKKGFAVPVGSWFKNGLLSINPENPVQGTDPSTVNLRILEHQQNKMDHRSFLWNYWLLNNWRERVES